MHCDLTEMKGPAENQASGEVGMQDGSSNPHMEDGITWRSACSRKSPRACLGNESHLPAGQRVL